MYCIKCGQKLEDGANFCFKCGSSVDKSTLNIDERETSINAPKVTKHRRLPRKHVILLSVIIGIFIGGIVAYAFTPYDASRNKFSIIEIITGKEEHVRYDVIWIWGRRKDIDTIYYEAFDKDSYDGKKCSESRAILLAGMLIGGSLAGLLMSRIEKNA